MNWIDRLERKTGRIGIKNLMTYIVGMNGIIFILMLFDPSGSIENILILNPSLVMRGQIWRLITFIFIPPNSSIIFIFFALYFYYLVGNALENEWGTFKFNLYYLIGMLGTAAAAMVTGFGATATYLNLSLFLAFAELFPDFELLLFFVLPVKIKYLAWLEWAFIAYTVLLGALPLKIAAIVSIINYFVFFAPDIIRRVKHKRQVYNNRKRYFGEINKRR